MRSKKLKLRCVELGVLAGAAGLNFWQQSAKAQSLYWDTNGALAGAGGTTPGGTWNAAASNWSTDFTGQSLTTSWTAGATAVFSAGTDAIGAFTVTVSGNQSLGGVNVEEGSVNLSGGTVTMAGSAFNVDTASGSTSTIASLIAGSSSLTKSGSGKLVLTNLSNNWTGKANILNGGILSMPSSLYLGVTPTSITPAYLTINNSAILQLSMSGIATAFQGNKGITIGSGGGTIQLTDNTNGNLLICSNTFSGSTGTLTIDAAPGGGIDEFRWVSITGNNTFGKLVVLSGFVRSGISANNGANEDNYWGSVPTQFTPDQITLGSASKAGWIGSTPSMAFGANRGITLAAGGGGIDGSVSGNYTFNGAITGAGTLTVGSFNSGANFNGFIILAGSNSYTGTTFIGDPTGQKGSPLLQIGNNGLTGSLDSPNIALSSTTGVSRLFFSRSDTVTCASNISGAGNVTQVSAGMLWLTGSNSYAGTTTLIQTHGPGGSIVFGSPNALSSSATVTVPNGNIVGAGYAMDQNFISRLNPSSGGVAALVVNSANNLDMSALGSVRLGAVGSASYSGSIIPNSNTYRLGGSGTLTVSSALTDAGNITDLNVDLNGTAGGTVILTATNTYSGATAVNGGTLLVNSPGSIVSSVDVAGGAVFGGTGVAAAVTVEQGGHLSPGAPPTPLGPNFDSQSAPEPPAMIGSSGTLTLAGDLNLANGAICDFDLDTSSTSDKVSMPFSTLFLNGQQFSDFNFTPMAGFGPGTYLLIDGGSVSGSLGVNTTGMIAGEPAALSVSGNDLVLTVLPEPGSLPLAIAAFGLIAVRRRRPAQT